jgi:CII-binding regulator of phage lambda lysogenization HflD
MEDQKTVEELVKKLRERVSSYAIAVIDLETLLEVEQAKVAELEKKIQELESSKTSNDKKTTKD